MTTNEIINKLFVCDTRKKGLVLIENLSVSDVANICKQLDIKIKSKKTNITSIIENTIGFRLRSNAIRNYKNN